MSTVKSAGSRAAVDDGTDAADAAASGSAGSSEVQAASATTETVATPRPNHFRSTPQRYASRGSERIPTLDFRIFIRLASPDTSGGEP